MADTRLNENKISSTTVVTAGDRAFAWGAFLLTASMRMNGMRHPVVIGAKDWSDTMKDRVSALGGVTFHDITWTRQCVTCQKPLLMNLDDIETEWVCWADADGMFVGDCSEWLVGDDPNEIVIRQYNPVPPDFNEVNLEVWRKDVERLCGKALSKSRYATRVNAPFIVLHRKWRPFLDRWQRQITNVLPPDVAIIMKHGSPYFQTDESVLGSLICFDPEAPKVAERYKANGSVDRGRYFAHFAYNPKPWQMWNSYSMRWRGEVLFVVDWLVSEGFVKKSEVPISLRRSWQPLYRSLAPLAPWVWRGIKLKRKLFRK